MDCDNKCECLSDQTNCNFCKHAHTTENIELKTELFEGGETLVYTKDGYPSYVKVTAVELNDDKVLQIRLSEKGGDDFVTTREHLHSPNNPDIGWIPSTMPEYRTVAKVLSDREINSITSPKHLLPIHQ